MYYLLLQIILCFCSAIVSLILWYRYSTWHFDYWEKQCVPGEKPVFFIGTLKPTWKDGQSFQDQDIDAIKKYGHINGGFIGRVPVLNVSDPDTLKQILLKDFHLLPNHKLIAAADKDFLLNNMIINLDYEKWKLIRSILSPAFTSKKLKEVMYLIEESAKNLIDVLNIDSQMGTQIEFTKKFTCLSLDIIASCAFGIKGENIKNPNHEFTLQAQKLTYVNAKLTYLLLVMPYLKWCIPHSILHYLFTPFYYFAKVAHQTIGQRFTNKEFIRKDLLQIMLESEMCEGTKEIEHQIKGRKILTRDDVVSQSVMFLVAGNDTTSSVFNMMAYELAINQDVQEKLIQEVDTAMADCKGILTYEIVKSLQFLQMVVSETLRKYPPLIRTDRACREDYNLNGILLKKGMMVNIPIYAIHHNPEFYPNPEKFDPQRFTEVNNSKRNPYTYIPFGAGPRNCIGQTFALLALKLVMIHILHTYSFQTCSKTQIPVSFYPGMGLLHAKSTILTVHKRF